jgi:hypothetical protein
MIKYFTLCLLMAVSATNLFAQDQVLKPKVDKAVYFDISPPLRDMILWTEDKEDKSWKDGVVKNYFDFYDGAGDNQRLPGFLDPALQTAMGLLPSDTTLQNFNGISAGNSVPPDTHGEIGPNHYFQVVNTSYAIYNKTGQKIFGPYANSSVWAGMPNNENSGDAVVLYDENANRWLFTQFSLPFSNGPFFQMIAISQTPDPMGPWYRWQYSFANMPDYPKFGVWPDGYYMTANRFVPGYQGTGAYGFDRTAMLAGNPNAQRISFEQPSGNETYSLLPSDCDGTFPPAGTPCYFTYVRISGSQHLGIWEFHADWTTPANSTFSNRIFLTVSPFTTPNGGIPQKDTYVKLETLADRLMCNTKYRVFNGYSAMVINHTVSAAGGAAGVRWYELRKPGTNAWTIHQQSTYAPADNHSRWMGSIAIDTAGSIALGYSVSSSTMYPAIRYTGRLKNDPLNTMTMTEKTIIQGGGSQTGVWSGRSRWGDYSGMSVDPVSPTTFWYTTEYYATTSSSSWMTRVGSFTFGNIFSISASAYPAKYCVGDTSTLHAVAYGGSGNYTYSWTSEPSGFTSNLPNPVVFPTATTKYIVQISDGSQSKTDTTRVNVILPPSCFPGNDTAVCAWVPSIDIQGEGANFWMIAWGTTGDGHFSTPTGLNTTYTFGNYDRNHGSVDLQMVALPIAPCYGNVFTVRHIVIDPCTGIGEVAGMGMTLKVSPNPARESVNITVSGLLKEGAVLSITNIEGQTISSETIATSATAEVRQIDLSGYRKGVYVVKLKNETGIKTERLVVQ